MGRDGARRLRRRAATRTSLCSAPLTMATPPGSPCSNLVARCGSHPPRARIDLPVCLRVRLRRVPGRPGVRAVSGMGAIPSKDTGYVSTEENMAGEAVTPTEHEGARGRVDRRDARSSDTMWLDWVEGRRIRLSRSEVAG